MPRCHHSWQALYQQPADKDFLSIYTAQQLDAFYSCSLCSAIGKRNKEGTILQLPKKKGDNQRSSAQGWSETIKTFNQSVNNSC